MFIGRPFSISLRSCRSLGHGHPLRVATPSDPVMSVRCTDQEGPGTCQGANGVDVNGAQINVPSGRRPDGNSDAHMTVIEVATGTEYDFWHTSVSGSTLTAGTGADLNANTSDGTGSAGDAAGFGLTSGLIRPAELASGQINHALVITVPCTNATGRDVGYTYPARGGWGEYCGQHWSENAATAPMLGQRYQLSMTDARIAASGAPSWEQTIMTALAHYGAYIEDTNGSYHYEGMDILTQDPASWTDVGQPNSWTSVISALGGSNGTLHSSVPIPVSSLQLVSTCVTQGTCPGAIGVAPAPSIPPSTTTNAVTTAPAGTSSLPSPGPVSGDDRDRSLHGFVLGRLSSGEHHTHDPAGGARAEAAALRRLLARRRFENSTRRSRRHAHRAGQVHRRRKSRKSRKN